MNTGIKLRVKDVNEIGKARPEVAECIHELRKQMRTRRVKLYVQSEGYRQYLDEGAKYRFFRPDGESMETRMVSQDTLGILNDGINYHVGQHTPPLPEGTFVVESEYFLGQPYISVHYVGMPQLEVLKRAA